MAEMTKLYSKILLQKNQTDLVSAPFYVGANKVAVTAYSGGTGLPPGGEVKFQEVLFIDGGRTDGTLCTPATFNPSAEFDYKPYASCGCEPKLSERMSYIEFNRPGWYRAVYSGPSRASVLVAAQETNQKADSSGCAVLCCPIDVDLTVDKAVSAEVITAGDTGTFTITIRNNGPEASKGGSIVDELPAGLTYGTPVATYTGGAQGTQPALAQFASGDWHYTLLPVGGVITVTIPFTADAPGDIEIPDRNVVKVIAGLGERDTNPLNNSDEVHFIVTKPRAALSVTKTIADDTLKVGDTYQYQVTVSNAGPQAAHGAILTDNVPSALNVTSIGLVYSGGASGVATLTRASLATGYAIPALPAGGVVTAVIQGTVPATGTFTNVATIKAPAGVTDSDISDNVASVPLTVASREADVWVSKIVTDEVIGEGDSFSFVVTAGNHGPDIADGMIIKDVIPGGLTINSIVAVYSAGASGPQPTQGQLAGGFVVPTMPVGGQVEITVSGVSATSGLYFNTATVKPPAGTVELDPSNNSATQPLQTEVKSVDVVVTKSVNAQSFQIGDTITYTVTVTNMGPDDANGTVLKDQLPSTLTNIVINTAYAGGAASAAPTPASLAAGWNIATLPAGGSVTLIIDGEAATSGVFTNIAQATPPANRNDINPGNNFALVVVAVQPPDHLVCGGGSLQQTDEILIKGSLKKCDELGNLVDVECGDIIKVLPDCTTTDCEINTWVSADQALVGAGICTDFGAPSFYTNGIAVFRGRDLAVESGGFSSLATNGHPGSWLQKTVTNNTDCPMLVEADLVGHGDIYAWADEDAAMGFVFNIGDNLNINMPPPTVAAGGFAAMEGTSRVAYIIIGSPTENTIWIVDERTAPPAFFRRILAPGQSVTIYGQWWAMLFESKPMNPGSRTIHGHMSMRVKLTKGAAILP
jgi:uncharacterized repeat protein (TIGR01451 family)